MEPQQRSKYFSLLRYSADEKLGLGLHVSPTITELVIKKEFDGLQPWNRLKAGDNNEKSCEQQRCLDGLEIWGRWSSDQSFFEGCYPIQIEANGNYSVLREFPWLSPDEVHQQIDWAEKNQLDVGISAQASICLGVRANAIIHADCRILELFQSREPIVIETTDGIHGWTYAHINFEDDGIKDYFGWRSEEVFERRDSGLPPGTIVRNGRVPCYPSMVLGNRVRLLSSSSNPVLFIIDSTDDHGICFQREPELTWTISTEDEDIQWSHAPDEVEVLFERSLNDFEKISKSSKELKRYDPTSKSQQVEADKANEPVIDLFDLLPHKLATALLLIKENLPYDSLCVLVSFLTGVASMLRLGTAVTGNEMTDYKVPVNLYTILRAPSGRKKSALQELFVNQPASDVLLKIAQENDRMMHAWREECRGQKSVDKPPQPLPVDIRINDYTGEAFVQTLGKLDEVGRAVLVVREEIAALFDSLNNYSKSGKGADEQQLLELYDGRGFRSLRVGDKGRAFSRAAVNIYGTIQPDILDGLLRNGDANGLWARFCFAAMPDMTKRLPTKLDAEKLKAFKDAQQYLKHIISIVYDLGAVNYKLGAEAMELFSDYELKKQENCLSTKISAQASLYGKSAGKVLRFAGLLHILEIVVNNLVGANLISASTLHKAIGLVDRLDCWTLACHAKLAGYKTDSLTPFQRRLHNIAFKSKSPMPWTDIRSKMSSAEKHGKDAKDAVEAMNVLVTLGLGEVTNGPNGGLYYKSLKPLPSK